MVLASCLRGIVVGYDLGLNEVWVIILLRGTGLTRRGWWLLVGLRRGWLGLSLIMGFRVTRGVLFVVWIWM